MKQGEIHVRGSGENIKWLNVYSPVGNPVIIWKWEKQSQAWKFWKPEKLWNSCVSESDKNQLEKVSGIAQWHGEHIVIHSFIHSINNIYRISITCQTLSVLWLWLQFFKKRGLLFHGAYIVVWRQAIVKCKSKNLGIMMKTTRIKDGMETRYNSEERVPWGYDIWWNILMTHRIHSCEDLNKDYNRQRG